MFYPNVVANLNPRRSWYARHLRIQTELDVRRYLETAAEEWKAEFGHALKQAVMANPDIDWRIPAAPLQSLLIQRLERELSIIFPFPSGKTISLAMAASSRALLEAALNLVIPQEEKLSVIRSLGPTDRSLAITVSLYLRDRLDLSSEEARARARSCIDVKARESLRPLYSLAVTEAVNLQAAGQPSYGEQVALDLGAEVSSYL